MLLPGETRVPFRFSDFLSRIEVHVSDFLRKIEKLKSVCSIDSFVSSFGLRMYKQFVSIHNSLIYKYLAMHLVEDEYTVTDGNITPLTNLSESTRYIA